MNRITARIEITAGSDFQGTLLIEQIAAMFNATRIAAEASHQGNKVEFEIEGPYRAVVTNPLISEGWKHERDVREKIKASWQTLAPRERLILGKRWGIVQPTDTETRSTLEEVARHFDITRERARQVEAKALEKCGVDLTGEASTV